MICITVSSLDLRFCSWFAEVLWWFQSWKMNNDLECGGLLVLVVAIAGVALRAKIPSLRAR